MHKKLKLSYNAPAVLTFVLLCFAATLLGEVTEGRSTLLFFSVYGGPLTSPMTWLRLFTHVLGHSGWEHFFGNAMMLLLLGPMLEEKYGSATMVKVILLTAVVTGLMHDLFWGGTALCGASGVAFACVLLASFTAFKAGEIPLSFILVAVMYIGREVVSGLTVQDNVSNITHILGGAVGSGVGYALNRKK